jgi:hypothetical protein
MAKKKQPNLLPGASVDPYVVRARRSPAAVEKKGSMTSPTSDPVRSIPTDPNSFLNKAIKPTANAIPTNQIKLAVPTEASLSITLRIVE